jgi:hypothetical protein
MALRRRQWLALAAAGLGGPAMATGQSARFAAAWDGEHGAQIGVLALRSGMLKIHSALDVPTRAHSLLAEKAGTLLAVARRPGDWIVRWRPGTRAANWIWAEPGRVFNGHLIASADRKHVYTTETDLQTGQGLIGLRDVASLRKLAEWSTHGMDPHELLLDSSGSLWVANGGIATLPETGRTKLDLQRMDSSLVRLASRNGALIGQWRLDDSRLSLRHLAWGSKDGETVLGIALQAEHDDPAAKAKAPVLALFDGHALRAASFSSPSLGGYAGAVAFAQGFFAVSCTRADGVALFDTAGGWKGFSALRSACALARGPDEASLWAGGAASAVRMSASSLPVPVPSGIRLDNHWLALAP